MKMMTLTLEQQETFHGEVVGIKDTIDLKLVLGKGNYTKLMSMLKEGDMFRVSVSSEFYLDLYPEGE